MSFVNREFYEPDTMFAKPTWQFESSVVSKFCCGHSASSQLFLPMYDRTDKLEHCFLG